ncbi:S9 family peptidase [Bailinhaonella thermotolerans]|uniref:S9 family peptidase n=1 Tax=Bailinhaonella thermotolerans TaxID=1070861 RepID=A0A3A4ALN8_9ACTN|nr:S9 family peptidase [Bailinhaonella thermotolerans]
MARMDSAPLWVEQVGDEVWWDDPRPHEGGRRCVVRLTPDGEIRDVLPPGWNARNRLIEYGGRSWRPVPGGGVVFTNWADQRLYLHREGGEPVALTPGDGSHYGDLVVRGDEVWCVRERGPRRDLVAVRLDGGGLRTVLTSHDFLMNPRVSPDGTRVAWIGWNHPNMPWDGTELCVAPLREDGTAGERRVVAGGADESVVQAEWRDDDTLYAVTDPTGWWNLYEIPLDGRPPRNLAPREEEFGTGTWKLGYAYFGFTGDGRVAAIHGTGDGKALGVLDPATGVITDVGSPHTAWGSTISVRGSRAVAVASTPYSPYQVIEVDLESGEVRGLSRLQDPPPREHLPTPRATTYPGADGRPVHAHVYPPAEAAGREPYLIFVHGGPTGCWPLGLDLEVAFFTSRGIGVAVVNYGGSTGYGRAYRERLRHGWGLVDVEDSAAVARGLVAEGLADPARLAIRGGSAGGWTSLCALVRTDVFRCAVAFYAITDAEAWAGETHDFESRYLDGLIGPLPETRERYADRSPTTHAARASGPALLMHGLEDVIVPLAQTERFVAGMRDAGHSCEFITFPGEQHGWRREETMVASLEAELAFYEKIFGSGGSAGLG